MFIILGEPILSGEQSRYWEIYGFSMYGLVASRVFYVTVFTYCRTCPGLGGVRRSAGQALLLRLLGSGCWVTTSGLLGVNCCWTASRATAASTPSFGDLLDCSDCC